MTTPATEPPAERTAATEPTEARTAAPEPTPSGVPAATVELLHALLAWLATEGDRDLGVLTAEELASVTGPDDGPGGGRLVPLPVVDELAAGPRVAALTAARRGLVARGLLATSALAGDVGQALELERLQGMLALLVWLRAAPDAVTWVEQETGGGEDLRLLYGISDLAVLEEQTCGDGLHRFTLRSRDGATTALAEHVDPAGRARDDGAPLHREGDSAPDGWDAVERAIAEAETVTRIGSVRRAQDGGGRLALSLLAGPTGLWSISGRRPPRGVDGSAITAARAVGPSSLHQLMLATLGFADPQGPFRAGDAPHPDASAPAPDG